jgi:hypothetical protein
MEIDEYIHQKKAVEAKQTLEEAKKRLREEKEKLNEVRKKARLRDRDDDPVYIPPLSNNSGIMIKPWMIWNTIFFLIIIALVLFFFTKSDDNKLSQAEVQKLIEDAKKEQEELAKEKELEEKIKSLEEKIKKEEQEPILIETSLPPVFTLDAIDVTDSNDKKDIGHKGAITVENNGTEAKYELIIKNSEKAVIICDADRTIEGKTKTDLLRNIKLDAYEKEDIPQEVTGTGKIEIEWIITCHFDDKTEKNTERIQFDYFFD